MGWKVNLYSEKTREGFCLLKQYGIPRATKYMKIDPQWPTRNENRNRRARNVNKGVMIERKIRSYKEVGEQMRKVPLDV